MFTSKTSKMEVGGVRNIVGAEDLFKIFKNRYQYYDTY